MRELVDPAENGTDGQSTAKTTTTTSTTGDGAPCSTIVESAVEDPAAIITPCGDQKSPATDTNLSNISNNCSTKRSLINTSRQSSSICSNLSDERSCEGGFNNVSNTTECDEDGDDFQQHQEQGHHRQHKDQKRPCFYEEWLRNEKFVKEFELEVPKALKKSLAMYRITAFADPSCFYAQEFSRLPLLYDMMKELTAQVRRYPEHKYSHLSDGDMVVIPVVEDEVEMYCRCVIWRKISYDCIKVLLIDFGQLTTTMGIGIKVLPADFTHIPCFAKRFHLYSKPIEAHRIWPPDAVRITKKFLQMKSTDALCHFFFPNPKSGVIHLQEINQPVVYDHAEMKWISGTPRKRELADFDKMEGYPLLQSLFCSTGVDIGFQNKSGFEVSKMSTLVAKYGYTQAVV